MQLGDDIYSNGCKIRGLICDKGTSFTGSPVAGQLFYRTDLATLSACDGAAWQVQADTDYVDAAVAGVGRLVPTAKTADYTAVAGDMVTVANATSSNVIISLPASPAGGDTIGVTLMSFTGAGRTVMDGGAVRISNGDFVLPLTNVGSYAIVRFDSGSGRWLLIGSRYDGRKFAIDVGDGATNPVVVVHGIGSLDVSVTVVEISTGADALSTVTRTDKDTVSVAFAVPATAAQYRVIVQG